MRHRAPVAVAAGFVLMLAIGLFVSLGLWRRAITERDRAVLAERLANDRLHLIQGGRRHRRGGDENDGEATEPKDDAHGVTPGLVGEGSLWMFRARSWDGVTGGKKGTRLVSKSFPRSK